MKPVMQTDFTLTTGNCGEACVASILEIELSSIPKLYNPNDLMDGHTYCKNLRKFLSGFGLSYIDLDMGKGHNPKEFFKDCWIIAIGPSPRSTKACHKHAVVWRNGDVVHDPCPDNRGLEKIEMYGIFIEMAPEKHNQKIGE